MRTDAMDQVRAAIKAFGGDGKTIITTLGLSDALGLETESQRQTLRRRLKEFIQRGELEKIEHGKFRFIPGSGCEPRRQGESYNRMWRIVRVQTPGWAKRDVVSLTRYDRSLVERYVNWLEGEGFVERFGRDGNTILWRTTAKGRDQRDTPWPPVDLPDPYASEKSATAALCTLMLTADLEQHSVRIRIQKHLATMTSRFCSQVEKNTETQGEPVC